MTPDKANLFIVGAPKCGTTAWVEYLRAHPNIYFPRTKEDCFFAMDLPRFRIVSSEADYAALFADSGAAKIRGEASAMYLFSEMAAGAIHDYNPDARILIFLRDQEAFLPSLHNQFLREFSEEIEDFETAWRLSGNRPAGSISPTCLEPRTLDYTAMGRFCEQVSRYLEAFPPDQIQILHFQEWIENPRAIYLNILDFLELDDDGRSDFPPVNQGRTYRSRRLVRRILFPPVWVRKSVQLFKRVTGFQAQGIYPLMHRIVRSLTAPGYGKEISPRLREEIRRYYADDNRRLKELLAQTQPEQRRGRALGDRERA